MQTSYKDLSDKDRKAKLKEIEPTTQNMTLQTIQQDLTRDNTALFVIDMQNDFSLPSAEIGAFTPISMSALASGMLKDIDYHKRTVQKVPVGWGYARDAPPVKNGSVPVGPAN